MGIVYIIYRLHTTHTSPHPHPPLEVSEDEIIPAKSYPPKSDEQAYRDEILANNRENVWTAISISTPRFS